MNITDYAKVKLLNLQRRYYIKKFNSLIKNTVDFELDESEILTVSILCHHNAVNMALAMLKSLYRFLEVKFPIEIHDDGSLTPKDNERFKRSFKNIKIIKRSDADKQIMSYLEENKLNEVIKFRKKHNVNMQFTDLSFFCNTKYCLQIDTDILFFNKPYFLQTDFLEKIVADPRTPTLYNIDRGPAYSYYDEDMERVMGKKMPFQFNAGLVLYPVDKTLHHFAENILKMRLPMHKPYTETQTIQCMQLLSIGECIPLDETVDVVFRTLEMNPVYTYSDYSKITCEHYCAWARNLYYLDFIEKIYPYIKRNTTFQSYYYKKIQG